MRVARIVTAGRATLPFDQRITVFSDDSVRQINDIRVHLPAPIAPGDSVAVAVHYRGILVGYTETGSLYIRDRVDREFTIIREDAFAFPVVGVPSWRANRAAKREPFAFSARITVPKTLVVAMGGAHVERRATDSLTTWLYRSVDPVPFLNVTIAPYVVRESAASRIFHFPADSSGARDVERAIAGALERFALWYGPLERRRQLVVLEIPEGFGSQASLSAGILQTADAFRSRSELRQLYHELSHLWNAIDLDQPSPRWNEGLATFLQWRMAAELDGWNDWDAQVERTAQSLLRRCNREGGCDRVPFADLGRAGVTDRSYSLGMLMFHVLHEVLGRDAFDRTYRNLFRARQANGVSVAQFAAAFRAASPQADRVIDEWFATTRWYARLAAGESVPQIVESYRP